MTSWTATDANELYNIPHWGDGYFAVEGNGHLHVKVRAGGGELKADLFQIAQQIKASGLSLPVLVRIPNILHDRTSRLVEAFRRSIAELEYQGSYLPVYPIKVNQQRTVVEHLVNHPQYQVGLEAGSKPELSAVLAFTPQHGTIVCNGYKDREYIRLALCGLKLGYKIFIVVEKRSELNLILEEAAQLGVEPLLGVRVRLASIGKGNWQNTGGDKSKFGLSAPQLLKFIQALQAQNKLHCLKLLHCHLGSQLANIRDMHSGFKEFARYFAEISALGVGLTHVDVGGGLGIDYEGTRSRSFCSMNYSLQEYANAVVQTMWEVCRSENLPQPTILTESGRAMTAHHAILISDVIDHESAPDAQQHSAPQKDDPFILHNLWAIYTDLPNRAVLEAYHDATHYLGEAHSMYTHSMLSLEQKARVEELFFGICRAIKPMLQHRSNAQREVLAEITEKLANKYFCNFSLFQSLPDMWALDQIFPIMPLHRLQEEPTQRATLHDLTCDSDGAVKLYVDNFGVDSSLPLHAIREGEPYVLGFFLVGAYQEILGDMHNLFGDTHSVNVRLTANGFELSEPEQGDSVDEVLRFVHFDPEMLQQKYREKLHATALTTQDQSRVLKILSEALQGYTYFEEE